MSLYKGEREIPKGRRDLNIMTDIERIENALEFIDSSLSRLNRRLSPYYEGKCNECGEKQLLRKSEYEDKAQLNEYVAILTPHSEQSLHSECIGNVEVFEEDL